MNEFHTRETWHVLVSIEVTKEVERDHLTERDRKILKSLKSKKKKEQAIAFTFKMGVSKFLQKSK